MSRKVVCGLSGGMDSTTVLSLLIDKSYDVHTFSFTYGSKHNQYENDAAKKVAKYFNVPNTLVDLSDVFKNFDSALLKTGGEIPEGHYEAENMSSTVVPMRNSIFLVYMAGMAEKIGADAVALGVHQGDHHIYPDCRKEYIKAADSFIYMATEMKVEVITPVLDLDKGSMIPLGIDCDAPYNLTRTCYKQQEISCGRCGSCVERIEGFQNNKLIDPIEYETVPDWTGCVSINHFINNS